MFKEARGDVVVFGRYYRNMERAVRDAVKELDAALPHVPDRCLPVFRGEDLPTRWLYHTARTHANFYESCRLRAYLLEFATRPDKTSEDRAFAQVRYDRWREVLEDERANTRAALPLPKQDPRLDVHNTSSGAALAPAEDLMRAKLEILETELNTYLPSLARRCGLREGP